jgi:hypothetical protein
MVKGIPVRIQKAGEEPLACSHAGRTSEVSPEGTGRPVTPGIATRIAEKKPHVEPKVEIREVNPGVFEITVTCSCGNQSVIRCESLMGH